MVAEIDEIDEIDQIDEQPTRSTIRRLVGVAATQGGESPRAPVRLHERPNGTEDGCAPSTGRGVRLALQLLEVQDVGR